MGGDGGSIAGRADVVRTKGFGFCRNLGGMGYIPNTQVRMGDERYSRLQLRALLWKTSHLSKDELQPPIVCDRLGRIYNKEDLLTVLFEKTIASFGSTYECIQSASTSLCTIYKKSPDQHNLSDDDSVNKDAAQFTQWDAEKKLLRCCTSGDCFEGSRIGVVFWQCGCLLSMKTFSQLSPKSYDSWRQATAHWRSEDHQSETKQFSSSEKIRDENLTRSDDKDNNNLNDKKDSEGKNLKIISIQEIPDMIISCPVCKKEVTNVKWDIIELNLDEDVFQNKSKEWISVMKDFEKRPKRKLKKSKDDFDNQKRITDDENVRKKIKTSS